ALPIFSISPGGNLLAGLKHKGYTHTHRFAILPSHSTPRWLLPLGSVSATVAGTQVYFPHKRAARFVKAIVIKAVKKGWSTWWRPTLLVASRGPLPLEHLLSAVTGEHQLRFAFSIGRRPAISKLTIQV